MIKNVKFQSLVVKQVEKENGKKILNHVLIINFFGYSFKNN